MPNYRYIAYSSDGKEISGEVFSNSENEAVASLKDRGIYIKEITLSEKKRFRLEKEINLSDVFLNLSSMISAGVMVPDAVRSLSMEATGKIKIILDEIYANLIKGMSLSTSMEVRRDFFPSFAISMVRAGEESGTLDKILTDLSGFLERDKEIKDRVRTAMIYPFFMISVSLVLIGFIFSFVFPKITNIFIEQKIPLPFLTTIFISISGFLERFWYILIIAVFVIFFGMKSYVRKNRYYIHKILYQSSIRAVKSLYISRFSRILGLLLKGGVPIVKALSISKDVTGNEYIAKEIDRAKEDIKEGKRLSDVIVFLPHTYLQIIHTGEKTGNLHNAFFKIADMAEKDFRKATDNFLRILEPSIILIMGIFVGLLVISILMPIFQMNQVIR